MNKNIFIACDTTNLDQIRKIIKETKTKKLKIGYKFGLEFFYSKSGRSFLSKINKNKIIFLDLKLNDIQTPCSAEIASLKDLKNIKYLTVHINGGYKMLKAVKKSARKIKKSKRRLRNRIHYSKNAQEISELVMIFFQKEILLDLSDGQNTFYYKDKKEFF
jgi:orotidine-5'-phosphate decarboxylase